MNQQSPFARGARATVLCEVAVLVVLAATLWPFNPFPHNGVRWIRATNGLRFDEPGLVVSSEPLKTNATESFSLELLLRPASVKGTHTILALYAPMLPRQFMVRQWNDGLLVTHDATVDRDGTKTIKFDVDHVFSLGRLVLVTISSGPKGTTVFLDGEPAASFPRFHISRSELSGQIILGTSPTTYHPWAGDLRGLAIYSKELTAAEALRNHREWITPSGHSDLQGALARYTLAEAAGQEIQNEAPFGPSLYVPARFSVPHKPLLQSAAQEFRPNWRYAIDGLINIAGFIPLGLIVCACLGWKRLRFQTIIITTISCGVLSLVIELLQYFVPRRGSGMTDIITNTLGAAIGAMLNNASGVRRALERLKVSGRS